MSRAVLALGSNLGDRLATMQAAIEKLAIAGVQVTTLSPVYETAPVGGPDQPDYLNAVVIADTDLTPLLLLAVTQGVEHTLGRERAERWGARTIDIDIVVYDLVVSDEPQLTLPHPRAAERAFVLAPWCDADLDAVLPGRGRVADLLAAIGLDGVHLRSDLLLGLPT